VAEEVPRRDREALQDHRHVEALEQTQLLGALDDDDLPGHGRQCSDPRGLCSVEAALALVLLGRQWDDARRVATWRARWERIWARYSRNGRAGRRRRLPRCRRPALGADREPHVSLRRARALRGPLPLRALPSGRLAVRRT